MRRAALLVPTTVLALVLTGCGSDDPSVPSTPPATEPAPSAAPSAILTGAPVAPSAAASPSASAGKLIAVQYAGGKVSGVEARVPVKLGEQVIVRVTSDVAEEVHVHGYDVKGDVPAGGTVEIPFTASIAGSFEVELEGPGKLLFMLRVS